MRLPVLCSHWKGDPTGDTVGQCEIGMMGGHPSRSYCVALCQKYDGPKEIREQFRAKNMNIGTPGKCGGCGRASLTTWFRIRWIGYPWPKRIVKRVLYGDKTHYDGCGCIYRFKLAWDNLRVALKFAHVATKFAFVGRSSWTTGSKQG